MSSEYAEKRIKDALKLARGNRNKARQQLIAWTYEDPKLLHALTKAHLSGIIAYNIERVASGRADAAKAQREAPPPQKQPPQKQPTQQAQAAQKPKKEESFGMQILKAASGSHEVFGLEDLGRPQKRGAASQNHINAIRALAKGQSDSRH